MRGGGQVREKEKTRQKFPLMSPEEGAGGGWFVKEKGFFSGVAKELGVGWGA